MIWKATLTTSVSSIYWEPPCGQKDAQCFYLKKQQQQQPAATLQYSLTTFLVRTNWGPKGRKKKFGDRPRPFPKGLDDRPLSPAPLSGTEKYCYRMVARDMISSNRLSRQ